MKQKSISKSVKAYLQIDIAFAIMIFFTIFITIYSMDKENNNSQEKIIEMKKLEITAKDLCTILISTPGSPTNWENDFDNTIFYGLKNSSSLSLNANKINHFNETNYFTIREKISTESYIRIKIIGTDTQTQYLSFGPSIDNTHVKMASYTCFSNYNSEIVKIIVEVWK